MLHIYPTTQTEVLCEHYQVRINGKNAPLQTARVSAYPFNRRWPGHQRDMAQSELVNFLLMEADEPLSFEIKPKTPFDAVSIRPQALGVEPLITEDGWIRFTVNAPAYFTVEPFGRKDALHVFVDPISRYSIDKTDKNVLYFGPGEHDVGVIRLESNQTLFLDEGAVVYACVSATDAENIKIIGRGILDNSRNHAEILFEVNEENNTAAVSNAVRRHTVQLEYCTNVQIEGITIRDSLVYNIRPLGCEKLDISNVKILGCWRYNSDGIDLHNCVNVNIENCFIRTFDDCICVKGMDCFYEGDVDAAVRAATYRNGKAYDVFKNVRVRNCVLWNDWGKCLEIGAETRAEEICDVVFEDCHVIHVMGRAMDCMNVDYADIHDITWRNISVEMEKRMCAPQIQKTDSDTYDFSQNKHVPILLGADVVFHSEYSANGARRGKNSKLFFENIHVFGAEKLKFVFSGYDEDHMTSDVTVKDVYLDGKPITTEDYELKQNEFCRNILIL